MNICFIGHRKIENEEEISKLLFSVVSALITQGAETFLFGSRSEFNSISWEVITKLKNLFPNIKRISYNAPHENPFTSKKERDIYEEIAKKVIKKELSFEVYDGTVPFKKNVKPNKNIYIMRNQEMIDASDICIFYYNKKYIPPRRKKSKYALVDFQPKSGTAIAFAYAKQKKKKIINIYELQKNSVL